MNMDTRFTKRAVCEHMGEKEAHQYVYEKPLRWKDKVAIGQRFKCVECGRTFTLKFKQKIVIKERKERPRDITKDMAVEWKNIVVDFQFQTNKSESNYLEKVEAKFGWSKRHTLTLIRLWLDNIKTFNLMRIKAKTLSKAQKNKLKEYKKLRLLLREPALWFLLWKNHKKFLDSLSDKQQARVRHFVKNVKKEDWVRLFVKLENQLNNNFNYHYQRVLEAFFFPYRTAKDFKDSTDSYKARIAENYFKRSRE